MNLSLRKPDSIIIEDGTETGDMRQCVHCGAHWLWVTGSKRKRGFCMNCMGFTCGNDRCHSCVPWQKKLDEYEKGRRKTLS